ncbi:hypothetical protein L8C07_22575 [Paenibacillus sp. CMAA1739]|uniref:COG4705 family protein n=1 Tax=Paenibacillus ottowii TaxID=2315729 RepID=UPI0027310A7B|nr:MULTISPECIES: hypothetical protein [Paenibacillus]MDP1512780.1 hypothetical protein [Paenibacillus ottowii]MEC4568741.1 hypothetical protein [Paenibacillus sp. CMAA1739]
MQKIAQVTAIFWIMKICATTLGETAGDLLSQTLNVGYAISSMILFSIFLISLMFQLFSKKYHPFLYWTVILTTSTAGTTMSDYMDRSLGLGYATGSFILVCILLAIFSFWYFSERSLNVNNITTRKVEVIYWIAILFSNTLGTALGDFLADSSGLGFVGGAVLIGSSLGLILLLTYSTNVSRVFLFWLAFVLTRPFGATFGDLLTKSHAKGGLDLGTMGSSLVLFIILIALIIYTTLNTSKMKQSPELNAS